jgi:uncharacterized membrane protein
MGTMVEQSAFAAPAWFDAMLHWLGFAFEAGGVAAIVLALLSALVRAGRLAGRSSDWHEVYHVFRTTLARGILLGLEFLIAADIIGTVAVQPTLENLLLLALIIVIRTFLSFALELEITGRWPWDASSRAKEQGEQPR